MAVVVSVRPDIFLTVLGFFKIYLGPLKLAPAKRADKTEHVKYKNHATFYFLSIEKALFSKPPKT